MSIVKKLFIFLFFILVFIIFFNKSISADIIQDAQNDVAAGFGCGYPNTSYNQCCLKSTTFYFQQEDLDQTINDLKSCTITDEKDLNKCLTNQEAQILLTLINTSDNERVRKFEAELISGYVKDNSDDKESRFEAVEKILKSNGDTYNNLTKNEKLKVQLRNSITREQCFINGGPIHGLCTTKIAGYFADQFGNDQNNQTLLESEDEVVVDQCVYGSPSATLDGSCICKTNTTLSLLCGDYISNQKEYNSCVSCMEGNGFWTGFGCIGLSFQGFVQNTLFGWGLGLAGIITLLCIIYAAFLLQTSAGNPERIKKARQYLTACITGLLLIIFSILILKIIGVNILKIPGFG